MKNYPAIQRIIASVLVLLFTFSVTPKKYWHDLVADHIDTYAPVLHKEATVAQKGFNCNADDIVVKAPFVNGEQETGVTVLLQHNAYLAPYLVAYLTSIIQTKDLRGPPAMV